MSDDQSNSTSSESNNETSDQNDATPTKKNFIVISLVFILVYTSYNAVTNLQSSINIDKNVGLYSLAVVSGCSVFSCLFLTNPLIFIGGYKWTIFAAQIGFILFIAANIYPKAWLMYPASAICGLFRAGFWTAQSAYIADLGQKKKGTGGNTEAKVNKYFGIFFSTFQSSQIWGNLILYLILRNSTGDVATNNVESCGANYLDSEQDSEARNKNQISQKTASILYGTFVGLIVISLFLVAIFLDQKRRLKKSDSEGLVTESLKYITSTFRQMKNPKQLLLLPLPFWIGASEAFTFGIFTNSFITCTVGIQYVGLVMIVFGVAACVFSVVVGYMGKFECRTVLFLIASVLCYASLITMFIWKPTPSQMYVLYILAGLSGLASAVWDPIEAALYDHLFPKKEEAAFSTMWLGQNTGYLVVYLYAGSLRVRTSIILQLVYLTIAMIGYGILEFQQKRKQSKTQSVVLTQVTAIMSPRTGL